MTDDDKDGDWEEVTILSPNASLSPLPLGWMDLLQIDAGLVAVPDQMSAARPYDWSEGETKDAGNSYLLYEGTYVVGEIFVGDFENAGRSQNAEKIRVKDDSGNTVYEQYAEKDGSYLEKIVITEDPPYQAADDEAIDFIVIREEVRERFTLGDDGKLEHYETRKTNMEQNHLLDGTRTETGSHITSYHNDLTSIDIINFVYNFDTNGDLLSGLKFYSDETIGELAPDWTETKNFNGARLSQYDPIGQKGQSDLDAAVIRSEIGMLAGENPVYYGVSENFDDSNNAWEINKGQKTSVYAAKNVLSLEAGDVDGLPQGDYAFFEVRNFDNDLGFEVVSSYQAFALTAGEIAAETAANVLDSDAAIADVKALAWAEASAYVAAPLQKNVIEISDPDLVELAGPQNGVDFLPNGDYAFFAFTDDVGATTGYQVSAVTYVDGAYQIEQSANPFHIGPAGIQSVVNLDIAANGLGSVKDPSSHGLEGVSLGVSELGELTTYDRKKVNTEDQGEEHDGQSFTYTAANQTEIYIDAWEEKDGNNLGARDIVVYKTTYDGSGRDDVNLVSNVKTTYNQTLLQIETRTTTYGDSEIVREYDTKTYEEATFDTLTAATVRKEYFAHDDFDLGQILELRESVAEGMRVTKYTYADGVEVSADVTVDIDANKLEVLSADQQGALPVAFADQYTTLKAGGAQSSIMDRDLGEINTPDLLSVSSTTVALYSDDGDSSAFAPVANLTIWSASDAAEQHRFEGLRVEIRDNSDNLIYAEKIDQDGELTYSKKDTDGDGSFNGHNDTREIVNINETWLSALENANPPYMSGSNMASNWTPSDVIKVSDDPYASWLPADWSGQTIMKGVTKSYTSDDG
ncbi:MAG TPA: hypothetical protein DCE52_18810, partial [Rhodobacteraceae bacterium]|nr:hypothetical protein [Paracoccaceae bacterium]